MANSSSLSQLCSASSMAWYRVVAVEEMGRQQRIQGEPGGRVQGTGEKAERGARGGQEEEEEEEEEEEPAGGLAPAWGWQIASEGHPCLHLNKEPRPSCPNGWTYREEINLSRKSVG